MRIRQAKLKDCQRCCVLSKIKELEWAEGAYMPVHYYEAYIKENRIFLVAEEEGKVIGYVLGERITWDIVILCMIATDPKYRGKGVGTRLITTFEKLCKQKGFSYVELHAPRTNRMTQKFYEKRGYARGQDLIEYVKEL